jgi:hypothetical protein
MVADGELRCGHVSKGEGEDQVVPEDQKLTGSTMDVTARPGEAG